MSSAAMLIIKNNTKIWMSANGISGGCSGTRRVSADEAHPSLASLPVGTHYFSTIVFNADACQRIKETAAVENYLRSKATLLGGFDLLLVCT